MLFWPVHTKSTSVFDYKWDKVAVVKLLVGILVSRIFDVRLLCVGGAVRHLHNRMEPLVAQC